MFMTLVPFAPLNNVIDLARTLITLLSLPRC